MIHEHRWTETGALGWIGELLSDLRIEEKGC